MKIVLLSCVLPYSTEIAGCECEAASFPAVLKSLHEEEHFYKLCPADHLCQIMAMMSYLHEIETVQSEQLSLADGAYLSLVVR